MSLPTVSQKRPARSHNPESILSIWADPSLATELPKAWQALQKHGLNEVFYWQIDPRLSALAQDCNLIVDQLDACHLSMDSITWLTAVRAAEELDAQGFDWTEADTFCISVPLSEDFAVTLTGWLNRTIRHGVPVLEMKLMGLNACVMGQSVPTQVPPRSAAHPDFRSFDGIHQRCEWAMHQIKHVCGEWPYGHYAISENEEAVVLLAESTDEPPSITLGDQILASAEKAGHDFEQGDYTFDERVVWGGQTYRVQGLANHAPGFAPVTQMAVKSVQLVNE